MVRDLSDYQISGKRFKSSNFEAQSIVEISLVGNNSSVDSIDAGCR